MGCHHIVGTRTNPRRAGLLSERDESLKMITCGKTPILMENIINKLRRRMKRATQKQAAAKRKSEGRDQLTSCEESREDSCDSGDSSSRKKYAFCDGVCVYAAKLVFIVD